MRYAAGRPKLRPMWRLKSLHVHINDLVAASFGAAPQLFIRAIACHKERKRRQRLAHT